MSLKSINSISVYEIDGKEVSVLNKPEIHIKSHWNIKNFVVIEFEGQKATVDAGDLKRAIDNAQNAHQW